MTKTILVALALAVLPRMVSAEPGSGSDIYRVNREIEAMMQDGRWQRLREEGQANKQAFDRLRQSGSAPSTYTSTTSTPPRP